MPIARQEQAEKTMTGYWETRRLTVCLHQYEATFRFEYSPNRFMQVWRVIDARTIGLATLSAMEWGKKEKADLQDIVELADKHDNEIRRTLSALPSPPVAEGTRFCRYCGIEIKTDAVFCENCGKQIA